jgi:hypothetical protein
MVRQDSSADAAGLLRLFWRIEFRQHLLETRVGPERIAHRVQAQLVNGNTGGRLQRPLEKRELCGSSQKNP